VTDTEERPKHYRILIVDDSQGDASLVEETVIPALKSRWPWLRQEIHGSISQAMRAAKTNNIALIMCDDLLPGSLPANVLTRDHPGIGFSLWLRFNEQRSYPFVLMSGHNEARVLAEAEGIEFALKEPGFEELKEKAFMLIERNQTNTRVSSVEQDIMELRSEFKTEIGTVKAGLDTLVKQVGSLTEKFDQVHTKTTWYEKIGAFVGAAGKAFIPSVKK
jgi:hypothetical protein